MDCRRLGAALLVIGAGLVVGCGGGDADSSGTAVGAAETANAYLTALENQDGETACSLLTENAQRAAVKVFEGQGDPAYPDVESLDPADCVDAISGIRAEADLPHVEPGDVEISADGTAAEVTFPDGNVLAFVADGDDWMLATPIATGR
jgi:hypothetical protein